MGIKDYIMDYEQLELLDDHEDEELLKEAVSGSAWMFYNHYNPDIIAAMQQVILGHKIEDVVDGLVEGHAYAEKVKKSMEAFYKKFPGKKPRVATAK